MECCGHSHGSTPMPRASVMAACWRIEALSGTCLACDLAIGICPDLHRQWFLVIVVSSRRGNLGQRWSPACSVHCMLIQYVLPQDE